MKQFRFMPIVAKIFTGIFIIVLVIGLTLSGVIDFFAVINDEKGTLPDIASNEAARFILTHTRPGDIVLNSTWFYHPASLAGRPIFAGYAYFTWSYGYDKDARERIVRNIYAAPDRETACRLLRRNHIALVELSPEHEGYIQPNETLWNNQFIPVYNNNRFTFYDVTASCSQPEG